MSYLTIYKSQIASEEINRVIGHCNRINDEVSDDVCPK